MPKSHKRKNPGVGADFKKAKHRVGKALPKAQNATDTTIKAGAISLPQQSVAKDKTGQIVTKRNLTIKEVISQCGHYSERTRKDALSSLSELIDAHPDLLRGNCSEIIGCITERFTDGDAACRKAALATFKDSLLPNLGPNALVPFISMVMAHIYSAMTHLAVPIRADGYFFLDALMHHDALLVASTQMPSLLQHFEHALSRSTRGASLKAGSLGALHSLVKGLETFLHAATAAMQQQDSTGGCEINRDNTFYKYSESYGVVPLAASRCHWAVEVSMAGEAQGKEGASKLLHLLLEAWGECSTSGSDDSQEANAATACGASILRCCDLILQYWGPDIADATVAGDTTKTPTTQQKDTTTTSFARAVVTKVAPLFPFQSSRTSGVGPLLQHNLQAAKVLLQLMPSALRNSHQMPVWSEKILRWIEDFFGKEDDEQNDDDLQEERKKKKIRKNRALDVEMYSSMLTSLSLVLPHLPLPSQHSMLDAVQALWDSTPTQSPVRKSILAFLTHLVTLHPQQNIHQQQPPTSSSTKTIGMLPEESAASWVELLPRFLWELGNSSPETTDMGLYILRTVTTMSSNSTTQQLQHDGEPTESPEQQYSGEGGDKLMEALKACSLYLPSLLFVFISSSSSAAATKKKKSASKKAKTSPKADDETKQAAEDKIICGPLATLPTRTQNLAIDTMCQLPVLSEAMLKAIAALVLLDDYPVTLAVRTLEALCLRLSLCMNSTSQHEMQALASLLLTVLNGKSPRDKSKAVDWTRYFGYKDAAVAAAVACFGKGKALQIVGIPLMQICDYVGENGEIVGILGDNSIVPAIGLLTLCTSASCGTDDVGGSTSSKQILPDALTQKLPGMILALNNAIAEEEEGESKKQAVIVDLTIQLLRRQPSSLLIDMCKLVKANFEGNSPCQQQQIILHTASLMVIIGRDSQAMRVFTTSKDEYDNMRDIGRAAFTSLQVAVTSLKGLVLLKEHENTASKLSSELSMLLESTFSTMN